MTTRTANRSARPGGWLLLLFAVLLASAAFFTWNRGGASEPHRYPQGAGDVDPNDPSRFKVVADGVLEDTSTGIQQRVPNLKMGENSVEALAALEKLLATNRDFRADLRDGVGPRPIRVQVKSIGVNAEVVPIGLDTNRALLVPRAADITGWWSGGFVPGEEGPTVIVGHFDSKVAAGVFEHLRDIANGAKITIEQSDGSTYVYVVNQVERLHKTEFPTAKVYGRTDHSSLRLVTCGGEFDKKTHHYVDNVIAYAVLESVLESGHDDQAEDVPSKISPVFARVVIVPNPSFDLGSTTTSSIEALPVFATSTLPSTETTQLPFAGTSTQAPSISEAPTSTIVPTPTSTALNPSILVGPPQVVTTSAPISASTIPPIAPVAPIALPATTPVSSAPSSLPEAVSTVPLEPPA